LALITLLVLGIGAWMFFRQLGLGRWRRSSAVGRHVQFRISLAYPAGASARKPSASPEFLALGRSSARGPMPPWVRYRSRHAVGMGVMEAFDIGAIFSVFTAAFVCFHALTAEGNWLQRSVQGGLRVAVLAIFAGFIATAALKI